MKIVAALGITIIVALMALFQIARLDPQKNQKEKAAFLALTAAGWLLSLLLVFFPDMPGPKQLIMTIYKPFGKILEQ
ncbi:hypothetical protein [Ammoniphilus sp. 3BR4]|uniref:hypothetical protein n=1 Tax=Ammoniphilus sp. 3BR4 TaxID=3158265 RepID=UPI00346686D9